MTSAAHRVRYSRAQYLAFEATSNVRHEYLDGQIYGMAGGTPEHAAFKAAILGLLFEQIRRGPYRAHDADLRVRVMATGLATYPDATIVCGERQHDPEDTDAVTNPTALFEVLSPSTEEYDRGDKFEHYKQITTLEHYVLVAQSPREIEVWSRARSTEWERQTFRAGDVVALPAIAATFDVNELYDAAGVS